MGNKHGKRKATSDSTSSPAAANKSSSPVKQQQQHASSSSNWLTLKNVQLNLLLLVTFSSQKEC